MTYATHRKTPYEYQPLQGDDIRLVWILPGQADEPLHLRIIHEPLIAAELDPALVPLTKCEIRQRLPAGWALDETPEGRRFFVDGSSSTVTYDPPFEIEIERVAYEVDALQTCVGLQYEALSYAWGKIAREDEAFVVSNDTSQTPHALRHLGLTRSLGEALRHLRNNTRPRCIWADAVCIDQSNKDECGKQVLRMRDIFRLATRAIVWLGATNNAMDVGMHIMSILPPPSCEVSRGGSIYRTGTTGEMHFPFLTDERLANLPTSAIWAALWLLLTAAWFGRLWVIQELTLASRHSIIQCGSTVVPWSVFRRSIILLNNSDDKPLKLSMQIYRLNMMAFGMRHEAPQELLSLALSRECLLPVDHVYGMLSMFGPKLRHSIVPSYGLPFQQVFREVFLRSSQLSQRLDLLVFCMPRVEDASMPSWVPDWRDRGPVFFRPGHSYRASGMSKAVICYCPPAVLKVTGVRCGGNKVSAVLSELFDDSRHVSDQIMEVALDRSISTHIRDIAEYGMLHGTYVTGEDMIDAFAQTLLHGGETPSMPSGDMWKERLLQAISAESADEHMTNSKQQLIPAKVEEILGLMRFFRTSSGHIGLGPRSMAPGDEIILLLGLYVPLVVRAAGNGRYSIQGWAYVHGLMYGEALLGPLPPSWRVEVEQNDVRFRTVFIDDATGTRHVDDPRLPLLSGEWRRLPHHEVTSDDPMCVDFFENVMTGEVIHHDPRAMPAIRANSDVTLEEIELI